MKGAGGSRNQLVSPVLQLVHAGVGRTADTCDLLPLLPLGQLLRNEIGQQRLGDVQEVGQLHHHVLTNGREISAHTFGSTSRCPRGAPAHFTGWSHNAMLG